MALDRWRVADQPCLESAGVEGIRAGDAVELRGADGTVLLSTLLVPSNPDDDQSCSLAFSMGEIPASASYSFTVAGRQTRVFTEAELAALDWRVDLSPESGVYDEPAQAFDGRVRLTVKAPVAVTLEAQAACLVSADTRYPEQGMITIQLDAAELGTHAGRAIGLHAELKLMGYEMLALLDLDVLVDGTPGYGASVTGWGDSQQLTAWRPEADNARGEVSLAHVRAAGAGTPLDTAVPPGDMTATLKWACGVALDPGQPAGEVHIGAPFDVDVEISSGRCEPPTPEGWRIMWLPFSGRTAYGSMSGELNHVSPGYLNLQMDIPNLGGGYQLVTSATPWDGEPASTAADGARYEVSGTLDFGRIGKNEQRVMDVPFEAWWTCPGVEGPAPSPFGGAES